MCERKCCKIVAIALTAVLALATILTFTITIKHAPQPPDLPTHHQVLEDGNLLTELAMLSSNLHNIKDTRKVMQDRFHRALRTYGWDNWALEELEKVKIMNDDATRLVNHAIGESEAWPGSWVHFANSAANMSSSLMPNLEKTEPRSRLLIVLQSTLSNLYVPGQSVEELEAHKGICDVSTFSVDFIATLLRPIARLHRAFNDLYVTFDLVEQVTGAMSNGTGTEGWRFSRKLDDYSCLAQNRTLQQCGTERQRDLLRILHQEARDNASQAKENSALIRKVEARLHRGCKKFQDFRLAQQCTATIWCTAPTSTIAPVKIVMLSMWEQFLYLRLWQNRLLEPTEK